MGNSAWYLFGDVAAWVDEEVFVIGESRLSVENLTRIVAGPNGTIGVMKTADAAVLNLDAIPFWVKADGNLCGALSKAWSKIELPDAGQRAHYGRRE